MKIRLTLPLPPRDCSPNSRGHWSKKYHANREYRARAEMEARRIPAGKRLRWKQAMARVTFFLPDAIRRDRDNLAASLKGAWDGIVSAGVLEDDSGLHHAPIQMEIDRERPRVEIEIEPM